LSEIKTGRVSGSVRSLFLPKELVKGEQQLSFAEAVLTLSPQAFSVRITW
jgi:hypothetical protein